MSSIQCAYCTDHAVGYDDEAEPTCGAVSCTPNVRPIGVVEVSADDDEDDA